MDVYYKSTALHMDHGPPPSSWETEQRSVHHSTISRQTMMLAAKMGQRKSIYASVPYRCNLVSLENRGKHNMYKRNGEKFYHVHSLVKHVLLYLPTCTYLTFRTSELLLIVLYVCCDVYQFRCPFKYLFVVFCLHAFLHFSCAGRLTKL